MGGGGGGHIWQGRRGIVDGVICLGGGATEILGGVLVPLCPPGLNPTLKYTTQRNLYL